MRSLGAKMSIRWEKFPAEKQFSSGKKSSRRERTLNKSQTGVWDPRESLGSQHRQAGNESQTRILGSTGVWDPWDTRNESQTRFRENESQTGVWDGDDDGIEILYSTVVDYRSKNGIKLTDDPIPGDGQADRQTGHCGGIIYR